MRSSYKVEVGAALRGIGSVRFGLLFLPAVLSFAACEASGGGGPAMPGQKAAATNPADLPFPRPRSTDQPKPAPITSLTIVPMGAEVPPELDGIVDVLGKRLVGLPVHVGKLVPLPEDVSVEKPNQHQVIWDRLLPKLPATQGVLYVISEDLGSYAMNFLYASADFSTARAVVSVSRMRDLNGHRTPPETHLSGEPLALATQRLQNQITTTTAKLLGMSYPCDAPVCALKFPRNIHQLDLKGGTFCEQHQKEYEEIARARGFAATKP